jgi:hypothetical protein
MLTRPRQAIAGSALLEPTGPSAMCIDRTCTCALPVRPEEHIGPSLAGNRVVGEETAERDAKQEAEARLGDTRRPVYEERNERCGDVGERVKGEVKEDPEGSDWENEQRDCFENYAIGNGEPRHGECKEIAVIEVAME